MKYKYLVQFEGPSEPSGGRRQRVHRAVWISQGNGVCFSF